MAEIKTLLDGVIETEISKLRSLPSGDEKRGAAIRELVSLHKLRIEEIRAQADVEEKSERRKMDSKKQEAELTARDADRNREDEAQARQLREQKIDRYVRTGVAAAELILPLVFYGIWMKRGFKFEESGVYSSTTFKNLFNRFKPVR